MKTVTLSEARKSLGRLIDTVQSSNEQMLITKRGSPAAVLMSYDAFESWKETRAVHSDTALMAEIKTGLKEMKARKARLYTLEELFR